MKDSETTRAGTENHSLDVYASWSQQTRADMLIDHSDRKSLEFEDLFSHPLSQEHHYEDILGQANLPHTWNLNAIKLNLA